MRRPGYLHGGSGKAGSAGAYARALSHVTFGVVPLLFTAYVLIYIVSDHIFASDFHNAYWPAGRQVLHGLSPYVDPTSPEVQHNVAFVYPAVAALLLAPLSLLPKAGGDVIFTALSLGAVLLSLRLVNVRDWRLYGIVLLWPPVLTGWQNANMTLLLVLGLAVLWRYRDRALITGATLALLVSVKLFLWPLAIFLLATRRYAGLAYAAAFGLAINAVAWTILGFDELGRYSRLIDALTRAEEDKGYSPIALAMNHGAGRSAAYALGLSLAAAAAVACVWLARSGKEQSAFLLCIAALLLATPILWTHYFALFIVPLAIARPRLSPIWVLPLALFVCPGNSPPDSWQLIFGLAIGATLVGSLLLQPTQQRRSRSPSTGELAFGYAGAGAT